MEVFKNWVLAIIGLILILVGVFLLAYTPYVGGSVLLAALGVVLVAINISAAYSRDASSQGGSGDYY